MDKLRVLSLFSGVGAPEMALRNLNIDYELIGFSEIDKWAIKSYCEIHGVNEDLNLGDITKIEIDKLPCEIDLITHGSPCQDFSVAGKGKGGEIGTGTRSSLMWNTVEIVKHCKPKYVLWENVKNVISKKHKPTFDKYINSMEEIGYKNYYKVLNAKDYGVPQNRERIFVVSILGEHKAYEFPSSIVLDKKLKDILENEVDEKYYITEEKSNKLISQLKDKNSLMLDMCQAKREGKPREYTNYSPTLSARDYKEPRLINEIRACLTPDRVNKRQNGRRFKEDGDPMFTLTSQDRHGILQIGNIVDTGNWDNPQRGRIYSVDGCSPSLNTVGGGGLEPKILLEDDGKC